MSTDLFVMDVAAMELTGEVTPELALEPYVLICHEEFEAKPVTANIQAFLAAVEQVFPLSIESYSGDRIHEYAWASNHRYVTGPYALLDVSARHPEVVQYLLRLAAVHRLAVYHPANDEVHLPPRGTPSG